MAAKFTLEEKLINTGDELKIDVLDDFKTIILNTTETGIKNFFDRPKVLGI